jgi:hypothetical protein
MNARTCQLCGKPLSRLRVGGDGEFCSREHRNQHGLRSGMVRLEEANKVTTLMRRRENPRQISAERLMCNSALARRGFLEPKQRELQTDITSFSPVLPGPAAPRVASGADRYMPPRAVRLPRTDAPRRADAGRVRINGRGSLPLVPPRRQNLLAQIGQAPLVSLRCETPAPSAAPRQFGMLRQGRIRVHLGDASLAASGLAPRGALALDHRTDPRTIESFALEGNALRVSIGIGFRVAAVSWSDFLSQPPAPAALVWPVTPRRVLPERHNSTAAHRSLEVEISNLRASLPASFWRQKVAKAARPAQFVFPGTLAPRHRRPAAGVQPATRTTDVSWRPSEPRSRGMAVVPPSAGFARSNGAHLFNIVLTPSSTSPVPQVAFTAFIPQEPTGCPKVAFEGTVAAAIAGSPGALPAGAEIAAAPPVSPAEPVAAVRIEEHFGSGWDNWMGGMKDWKVDVAGVRTGPLALFVPSRELIDYELDFLARIDTHSLNWVVRAAGLDEYLRCTLTAVDGGELEFSRCAVVAGVAQPPVTAPHRLPGKPRSAMTVGTRVSGDTFTVSLDGKNIDTWDDARFPMGGIGFMGAPDDRARLYWVRLSSTELTAKEYQKT